MLMRRIQGVLLSLISSTNWVLDGSAAAAERSLGAVWVNQGMSRVCVWVERWAG
jgi:hypothetical protein